MERRGNHPYPLPINEQIPSKFKVLDELPSLVAHSKRFKAHQAVFDREVELRLPDPQAGPPGRALFEAELRDLTAIDDPAFLPVLDRGGNDSLPFYAVPLRDHPRLGDVQDSPSFPIEARCEAVRRLATGLGSLHLLNVGIGVLDPSLLCFDRTRNLLYFLHHRGAPPDHDAFRPLPYPEDLEDGAPATPAADVFRWGCMMYELLTLGDRPYPAGRTSFTPIRSHVTNLTRGLAHVIEASLAWDPGDRPANGAELSAVLAENSLSFVPDSSDALELSGTIASAQIGTQIEALREQGRIPAPGQSRSMEIEAPPPAVVARSLPQTPKRRAPSGPLVVGLLGVAALVGLGVWVKDQRPSGTSPPATRSPGSHPPTSRAPTRPAASGGGGASGNRTGDRVDVESLTKYQGDSELIMLIRLPEVGPPDFLRIWRQLRSLVVADRMPPPLDDRQRIIAIRSAFRRDQDQGAADLTAYLAELRIILEGDSGASSSDG